MSKPGLRVYLVAHGDGRVTGILMRRWDAFFEAPPPAAYGESEEAVVADLQVALRTRLLEGKDSLDRYLWTERFEVRRVDVAVFPQVRHRKQSIVGSRRLQLRLGYAFTRLPEGSVRLMLPRFGWWITVEDLAVADEVLATAVSAALLGESARSLYDFRSEGEERVVEVAPDAGRAPRRPPSPEADASVLAQVAEELVDRARRRRLPPCIGRSPLEPAHLELLGRDPRPSILLVGPPGVGKSVWVRELARHHAAAGRREGVRPRIWQTSAERILAGMAFLGQWQKRCLAMVEELSQQEGYLHVDRLSAIARPQSDGSSIADFLAPAIASGDVGVIAEATESELALCRRRHARLVGSFEIVRISPPSREELPELLAAAVARQAPALRLHPGATRRLLHHLQRLQPHQHDPGRTLRFADWLAGPASGAAAGAARTFYASDASALFSRYTGIPAGFLADEVVATAAAYAAELSTAIVGQEEACDAGGAVLARFKAGLNDPERPVASLLFAGPTGVGKTELAKQLARTLFGDERRLAQVDMSELSAPGAFRRLLDVGPGVTSLAQRLHTEPLSVVLLDEIEKAHGSVHDLLLGMLSEGRLTDALGRNVDLRMAIVVLTSNLGAGEAHTGFAGPTHAGHAAIRRFFRPELVNRLDRIVAFRPLEPEHVRRIVDLEVPRAAARAGFVSRGISLVVDRDAREALARAGHDPARGARPLQRLIEERVVAPAALLLAADPKLRDRRIVVVRAGSPAEAALGPGDLAIRV